MALLPEQIECKIVFHIDITYIHSRWTKPNKHMQGSFTWVPAQTWLAVGLIWMKASRVRVRGLCEICFPRSMQFPAWAEEHDEQPLYIYIYILYTPREQVTEISFHQTPSTKPCKLGLGITPTDFEKHFGQARLWPIIKPQLWCWSACCYHSSVHVKLIKKILQKLGVKETSGYLCSQYFCLAY